MHFSALLLMSICCRAGAWGQNAKFSGFSILATSTIEIFRFLDVVHPEYYNWKHVK